MQSRSFCVNLNFDLNLGCFNDVSFGMILLSVELIGVMIKQRNEPFTNLPGPSTLSRI
jgi:hypothetical protein